MAQQVMGWSPERSGVFSLVLNIEGINEKMMILEWIKSANIKPGVFVPKAKSSVASNSSQSLMNRMEHDIVDSEYVLWLVRLRRLASVALEREIVLWVIRLYVLDCHSTFDWTERESDWLILVLVQKYANTSVLVF